MRSNAVTGCAFLTSPRRSDVGSPPLAHPISKRQIASVDCRARGDVPRPTEGNIAGAKSGTPGTLENPRAPSPGVRLSDGDVPLRRPLARDFRYH